MFIACTLGPVAVLCPALEKQGRMKWFALTPIWPSSTDTELANNTPCSVFAIATVFASSELGPLRQVAAINGDGGPSVEWMNCTWLPSMSPSWAWSQLQSISYLVT